MKPILRPAVVLLILLTLITGIGYPLVVTGVARVLFPGAGGRESHREGRQAGGIAAHRPAVQRSQVLLESPVRDQPATLQRPLLRRLESRAR